MLYTVRVKLPLKCGITAAQVALKKAGIYGFQPFLCMMLFMKKFSVLAISLLIATSSFAEEAQTAGEQLEQMALGDDPVEIELGVDNPPLPPRKFQIFGLDFSRPQIHVANIIETGKVPWEIPVLIDPRFTDLEGARHNLSDDDYVIALEVNGEVKLYPLRILNWHKGVNDVVGGRNVFVSWDPLSGHATAFDRDILGETRRFADSGLVYRSSTLYFDEQSQSLWLPIQGQAVTGKMVPEKLRKLPVVLTFWKEAREAYPYAQVMDFNIPTEDGADYSKNPFGNYGRNTELLYPVAYGNDAMPRKEPVLGVTMKRGTRTIHAAFSMNALLGQTSPGVLEMNFETGRHPSAPKIPLNIELDQPTGNIKITSIPEAEITTEYSYWFSWIANHPNSYVIKQIP